MIKVVTYGTFDYFHYGHYSLLERAKSLGDYLIVGISSDAMAISKGKATILPEGRRMEIVGNLKFVDQVILEDNMEQKVDDIKKYGINRFVLGSDYKEIFPQMPEYKKLIDAGCEVVFLERTPDISTSDLKKKLVLQSELDDDKTSIHNRTKD